MFEKMRGLFKPVADFFAKYLAWIHPNVLSVIGLLLGFIPAYFYANGKVLYGGISLIVYFVDFLDGAVARYRKKVTAFGAVLDASFDRIVDGIVIFSIALGGFVNWYLTLIVFLGYYLPSFVRARTGEAAGTKDIKLNVGFAQRGDRVFLLMLGSLFYFENIQVPFFTTSVNSLELTFVVLAILTWLTVGYRLYYAHIELGKRKL